MSTKEYRLERYHARRREAIAYLGGKCVDCGSTDSLEVDHIDPATKAYETALMWGLGTDKFWDEVRKCQLLCKPHHIAKTASEQRNEKHGSWAMLRRKCKCTECMAFQTAYNQQRVLSS